MKAGRFFHVLNVLFYCIYVWTVDVFRNEQECGGFGNKKGTMEA